MNVEIKINHALKKFGDNVIIPDLSLDIHAGERGKEDNGAPSEFLPHLFRRNQPHECIAV